MGLLNMTRKGKGQGGNVATLNELQAEEASLLGEVQACDAVVQGAESSVDEIERAMTRKAALEVRLGAVRSKIGAERARIREEERAALQAQGEALKAKALKASDDLLEPMLALFNAIGTIHDGIRSGDALLARTWDKPYPYLGVPERSMPAMNVRVELARQLANQFPERFSMPLEGLVDKRLVDKAGRTGNG